MQRTARDVLVAALATDPATRCLAATGVTTSPPSAPVLTPHPGTEGTGTEGYWNREVLGQRGTGTEGYWESGLYPCELLPGDIPRIINTLTFLLPNEPPHIISTRTQHLAHCINNQCFITHSMHILRIYPLFSYPRLAGFARLVRGRLLRRLWPASSPPCKYIRTMRSSVTPSTIILIVAFFLSPNLNQNFTIT